MKNRHFGKLLEIFIGLLVTFSLIAIVFAGFYYTFGYIKKGLNANVVYSDISTLIGPSDWVVITLLTSSVLIAVLWFLQKKGIFEVNF